MARWVERDGERVVLEETPRGGFKEELHPRGRGGKFIKKLGSLPNVSAPKGLTPEQAKASRERADKINAKMQAAGLGTPGPSFRGVDKSPKTYRDEMVDKARAAGVGGTDKPPKTLAAKKKMALADADRLGNGISISALPKWKMDAADVDALISDVLTKDPDDPAHSTAMTTLERATPESMMHVDRRKLEKAGDIAEDWNWHGLAQQLRNVASQGRGAFGWPATQHPGQSSNDAPEPPRKIDVDTSEIVAPGPVDIANGWKSEGTRGDYADQFGDMAVGQAYVSRYTNPATGDTVEIGRFIEYDQARNQPGNPYRYTVQTQTTEWNAKDDPSGDYADISYDDEDVMFYMSYGDALKRLLALAKKDETSMFSGEPVGAEGRAKATPGQGRLFEGARWVEREGQRFIVEADGKCKMPHAAMSKRGKKICPNCKAKIGDVESTEEDAKEKVEEARRGQVTDQEIADEARRIEEAADSMRKASTHKHGLEKTPGKSDNWVERTGPGGKRGQLPAYIQHIALALKRKRGMPTSQAIAIAIGTVKRWARGGGNVDANTRAAAAKALAEWTALKGKAHAK